jgi:rod shape-determining protein MreD
VRKTLLAIGSLAVALVLQLVVLNGLHLPGGGVPDLLLVLVAVLAITGGPVRGMVTGFAAGLVLDLAPPGSAVLGEYALTFCLVGWAAGKLSGLVDRSALRSLLALAGVVALGEAIAAGLTLGLDPAQLTLARARQVLPAAIGYDLLILPFALYLALIARGWAAAGLLDSDLDHANALTAAHKSAKRPHRPQEREPQLGFAVSRPHDGWVGSGPLSRSGGSRSAGARNSRGRAAPPRLRPGHGVAGSAVTGVMPRPGLPAVPVNIRFGSSRRRSGAVGNSVGAGLGRHPGQHPGVLRSTRRGFRPHGGVPGGSASGQSAPLLRPAGRRPVSIRFGSRRGDGSVGRLLGTPRSAGAGFAHASPGLLDRSGRSRRVLSFRRPAAPRFRSGSPAPPRSRSKAEPKFRRTGTISPRSRSKAEPKFRRTGTISPALAASLSGSGTDVLAARRRHAATPRLRVAPTVRPARPATPSRPRFAYGRRSPLALLVRRRARGKLLGRTRVGGRMRLWLIGTRTGGTR